MLSALPYAVCTTCAVCTAVCTAVCSLHCIHDAFSCGAEFTIPCSPFLTWSCRPCEAGPSISSPRIQGTVGTPLSTEAATGPQGRDEEGRCGYGWRHNVEDSFSSRPAHAPCCSRTISTTTGQCLLPGQCLLSLLLPMGSNSDNNNMGDKVSSRPQPCFYEPVDLCTHET